MSPFAVAVLVVVGLAALALLIDRLDRWANSDPEPRDMYGKRKPIPQEEIDANMGRKT